MIALMKTFARDRRGATAIEYGLIIAMIAVTILSALTLVAQGVDGKWLTVADGVDSSM